jgi:HK97 family phage major capsid protein
MELNNVRELLSTDLGTEGQLLIVRKIFDTLIPEVEKSLIPRSEAAIVETKIPGSSLDVDLITENTMDVREVGEGAEFPLDQAEYTSFNLKPVKYGVAIRITKELMEDGKWNLLANNIELAGRRLAENENSLIVSNALDNASNTVAGGAAITIANITRAMQYLEDVDYSPTTLFVGMEVLNDLRNIDTFVEADKLGSREMLQRGFVGVLYGLNVIRVSTNAGMTTTSSYVTDRSAAYIIAEKRPITVEGFDLVTFDMTGSVVSQRITVRQLRANAIAKITTS